MSLLAYSSVRTSGGILLFVALAALLSPLLSPNDYLSTDFDTLLSPPLWWRLPAQQIELVEKTAPPRGVSKNTMSQRTRGQVSPLIALCVWVNSSFTQW